jgi:hypothetical protein
VPRRIADVRHVAAVALIISCLSAGNASARWDFKLVDAEGKQKPGGQVCFIKVERTATADPARMLFGSNDVHCLAADDLIDVPPYPFLVYATHPDGYVSRTMDLLVPTPGEKPGDKDECLVPLRIPVVRAATVDLTRAMPKLADGAFLAAWTSDSVDSKSMIYPAAPGATTLLVPAGRPFVVLEIGQRKPLRASDAFQLRPGEVLPFDFAPQAHADVVTWASVDRQFLSKHVERRSKFGPIRAVLTAANGKQYEPVFPMLHGSLIHGTLQIFKNVPPGAAHITAVGEKWTAETVPVDVPPAGATLVGPLRALPAAVVSVTYSITSNGIDAASQKSACGSDESSRPPGPQLVVKRCQDDTCVDIATRPLAQTSGIERIVSVPAGSYTMEIVYGEEVIATETLDVRPNHEVKKSLNAQLTGLYGHVSRGGKPVAATVTFATGQAVSDPSSGRYAAVLSREPDRNLVDIRACDGSFRYTHIPQTAPEPGKPFDIDIPVNGLRVQLIDAADARPLPGAKVWYAVVKPGTADSAIYTRKGHPDANGTAEFEAIPIGRELKVCAKADDYRVRCLDAGMMKASERRNVVLSLARESDRIGTVISPVPLERASLFRVTRGGPVTHEIRLKPDGTFHYDEPPGSGEYFVVVSANLPLYVLPAAELPQHENDFRLVLPQSPSRSVVVSTSEPANYAVAIAVNGHVVPTSALSRHQGWRGGPHYIPRGGPLTIEGIAQTGPIVVLRGPTMDRYPRTLPPGMDVFSAPEYASDLLQQELGPTTAAVVFD